MIIKRKLSNRVSKAKYHGGERTNSSPTTWTEEDLKILYTGLSHKQISVKIGKPIGKIAYKRQKLGIRYLEIQNEK